MAPYDDWNKLDEDDEDELQDFSVILLYSGLAFSPVNQSISPRLLKGKKMLFSLLLTAPIRCLNYVMIQTMRT